jgi:hypothetical protein
MDTLKELLALAGFGPENIQALLYISLASVFVPQFVKRSFPMVRAELISVLSGAGAGVAFLPDPARAAVVGIVIACFWTAAYKPVMRLVYKKWPDLEDKVSAVPRLKRMADGELGIKADDDSKTRVLTPEERKELGLGDKTVPKESITPDPSNE